MNYESIEKQLFSWSGWDGNQESMTFYDPVLKIQIGKFPAGTKFDSATIVYDKSILQLTNYTSARDVGNGTRRFVSYFAEYTLKIAIDLTISE